MPERSARDSMRTLRPGRSWLLACAVMATVACTDSASVDPFADTTPPTVSLKKGVAGPDSVLNFALDVSDNLGIKSISVRVTGGVAASFDTTFTSAVTSTTVTRTVTVPNTVPPGTSVTVTASATDGAGNKSTVATLLLAVGNLIPPDVRITSPASGAVAVIGKSLVLSISAKAGLKVRAVGFQATGAVTTQDSTLFASPLKDSVAVIDTLAIPANATPGQLILTPFVLDSLGQRSLGPAITLTVQTVASTSSAPVVNFGLTSRVEVSDTIHVEATDQTGITTLGYEVRTTVGGAVEAADSIVSDGSFTSLFRTFRMRLPYTTFPTRIFVKAFARNSNGVRAYALTGGVDRVDTVTVVGGVTNPLPQGGLVADALYHPGTDRLYLTNIERNRLEVFSLLDSSFKSAIATGSRPWGIAPWPRDRNGATGDTLLVANSGGTSIGYIDLKATSALSPSGREVYTYPLPNIIAFSVTSVESQTAPGTVIQQRTRYDFSDRPQYLAAVCQGLPTSGPCGDVVVVYSTSPTGGQSLPFANKGTMRWENLTRKTSHFFFEQAEGQGTGRADTLEVFRFAAGGVGSDSTLVPYMNFAINTTTPTDSIPTTIIVELEKLGFRDTTFTRNSANFRRAIIGEGGPVLGSRALYFDITRGPDTLRTVGTKTYRYRTPPRDLGISPATSVSDFIANAFARVKGVAINFDGELAAIRGDTTALIDPGLRLQGLLQTSGGNPGFDFHPSNSGNGVTSTRQVCFAFAASTEPVIEVYENHNYARVSTVPIRDPIIGPIKAVRRGATIVLIGATARGVVVVTLADTYTASGCP